MTGTQQIPTKWLASTMIMLEKKIVKDKEECTGKRRQLESFK